MKHPVRRRLAAQNSLERIVVEIAEHDLDAAYRFVDAVEASLALLSDMPEAGARYETDKAALAGRIRKWVVPRYRRYLLFYIFEKGAVHLIDVVDGRPITTSRIRRDRWPRCCSSRGHRLVERYVTARPAKGGKQAAKGAPVRKKSPRKKKGAAKKSAKPKARKPAPLEQLRTDESTQVLLSLTRRHPELRTEIDELALALIESVDVEKLGSKLGQRLLEVDIFDATDMPPRTGAMSRYGRLLSRRSTASLSRISPTFSAGSSSV